MAVKLPVDTLNVADVALAATVTEAGAVNVDDALFVRATTVAAAGAAESVTVQVVFAFGPSVLAVQPRVVTVTGACSNTVADAVLPFSDPVRVAV